MNEPQPYREADRRHPHVSHEELRRQLLDADEDRYRLRNELREPRPAPGPAPTAWLARRRMALGIGTVIVTGLAGGLAWQMCPSLARADDRSTVRVETIAVTPRLIVNERSTTPPSAKPVKMSVTRGAAKARVVRHVDRPINRKPRAARAAPRPLSPGEFGRSRLASTQP